MRRLSILVWGSIALFGALLQFVTSIIWERFKTPYSPFNSVGEYVYMSGQAFGELCYLICILHFLNVKKVLWCAMGFVVDLAAIDCVNVLFFNPFEPSITKSTGIIIACIILVIRLKSYDSRT